MKLIKLIYDPTKEVPARKAGRLFKIDGKTIAMYPGENEYPSELDEAVNKVLSSKIGAQLLDWGAIAQETTKEETPKKTRSSSSGSAT